MRRGTRVGQAYVSVTADGDGINEAIVDAVDDAGNDIDSKGEKHGEDYGDGFSEGFLSRMRTKLSDRLSGAISSRESAGRAGDEAGESFVDRMSDKVRDLGDKVSNELGDRLASNPESVRRGINRAFDDDFARRIGSNIGDDIVLGISQSLAHQTANLERAIGDAVSGNGVGGGRRGRDGGLGSVIGRLFGAGSRNNALNLIGKSIGGIVSLTERAGKFMSGFADGIGKAADNASLLQKFMSGLSGGGAASGISGALSKLAASGPIAVASLGAVIVVLSAMASVAGALVGILTALASTIASALVGAVAVAGPLLGALATAAGLVTIAFTSMTNAQKDYLFSAFQPFKAALTGIGQIIMREFTRPLFDGQSAIQIWSANLQQALLPLAGVAASTATAFAQAGNIITASLSGPGFQRFFSSLSSELPAIVINLSNALSRFLNGVGGLFAAIMPYVTQFSRYLADVALRFSNFANSAKGQNSISDFVGRALDSLKSLWNAVREIGGFISDVLFNPTSQRAGNSIFDSIADTFAGFRRAFQQNIDNGNIERWFNDAIEFGGQLWGVIKALWDVFMALYNSGVLHAVGESLEAISIVMSAMAAILGPLVDALGGGLPGALGHIPDAVKVAMGALFPLYNLLNDIKNLINFVGGGSGEITVPQDAAGMLSGGAALNQLLLGPLNGGNPIMGPVSPYITNPNFNAGLPNLDDLIASGNTALNNTYQSAGGYMPDPEDGSDKDKKKKKKNKFTEDWAAQFQAIADSILQDAPRLADEIRAAARDGRAVLAAAIADARVLLTTLITDTNSSFSTALKDVAGSTDFAAIASTFESVINQAFESANNAVATANSNGQALIDEAQGTRDRMVAQAQSAVDAAARRLASASTKKEGKEALKELEKAQRNLDLAKRKGEDLIEAAVRGARDLLAKADASVAQVSAAAAILGAQAVVNQANVQNILGGGVAFFNATLADWAEARRIVAERLEAANQKLADAIALRDNYSAQVADSIRSFGSLLSAQAKTIDGVQQALTSDDIVTDMRARLEKVKAFQEDLRLLLAQGLSDAAYKQLVDAGVEGGSAYAEALVAGGQGAISEVNSLTSQFDANASAFGDTAASHLYQAGVNAAQGLVDGLNSLSDELTTAATALGTAIAQAIRDALGIASPSTVLRGDMGYVGDGAVLGLDDQAVKVSAAAARLAGLIRVSPEVAAYASAQGTSPTTGGEGVSGNGGPQWLWTGDIVTPTEDPVAVANEVINEITGRLP